MKKDLEKMLDKIESFELRKDEIYKELIELHEDSKLRKIAGPYCFEVAEHHTMNHGYTTIRYDKGGFRFFTPSSSRERDYDDYPFKVEDGKLVVEYDDMKKELLELFPLIEVKEVEDSLEEGLGKIEIYKRAMEEEK